MKAEGWLFAGIAVFFACTAIVYSLISFDPAGKALLWVSFLMSSLVSFFFSTQYRRRGVRPEDRRDGEIRERAGPVDFFPPQSVFPLLLATGFALAALGIVFGFWLFCFGIGTSAAGIGTFVFQYNQRGA